MNESALLASIQDCLRKAIGLDPRAIGNALISQAMEALRAKRPGVSEFELTTLIKDPAVVAELVDSVVVPETWFLRDPPQFADLASRAASLTQGTLNVLSLPCSSGEEPLSIAGTLLAAGRVDFHVWGVDVAANAIALAQRARYSNHSLRGQPSPSWLARIESEFAPYEPLQSHISYLRMNLLDPELIHRLPKAHVIFSRNFMIYLHAEARVQWLHTLKELLLPGGVIYTGSAEPISQFDDGFTQLDAGAALLYQRSRAPASKLAVNFKIKPEAHSDPTTTRKTAKPPTLIEDVSDLPPSLYLQAVGAADRGLLSEAAALLATHLQAAPLDVDAWNLSALVQLGLGQEAFARERWERVLYLDRRNASALQHLLVLATRSGDAARAEQFRRRLQTPTSRGNLPLENPA